MRHYRASDSEVGLSVLGAVAAIPIVVRCSWLWWRFALR